MAAEGDEAATLRSGERRAREAAAVVEEYLDSGLSDGLPAVPPTETSVADMIAAMGRQRGAIIGQMPPGNLDVAVEHLAANAVLAGCRPEYGPVVLAAVEAMLDDRFALYGIACSTKGAAPLVIVNGPIRHRLGMKSGGNVFGHGVRANATIGRALRLIIQNVAQAVPDVLDRATLGHPGKYSYCIAENEEGSYWEPLHVERGLAAEQSAVTVFGGEAPHQINVPQGGGEAILLAMAQTLAVAGLGTGAGPAPGAPHVLVVADEHRTVLAEEGWTKAGVKEYVADNAVLPAELTRRMPGMPDDAVRTVEHPDSLLVVAAGGSAGRFSSVLPGWTWQSQPVTVAIPDHPPEG
jgi:hypothetical protein